MKEPYVLPNEQCERLTRIECMAMEMFLTSLSNMRYAQADLQERLECVPGGRARMNMVIGQMSSLVTDVCGTISDKQRKHLWNICKDMEVRLVPKMTQKRVSVVLTEEEARELIDAAQEGRCQMCVLDVDEARECKLCKLLECVVPLDSYKSHLCPYALAEWEDDK